MKVIHKETNMAVIETERLIFRCWQEADAEALYKYASDERVSELALWPRHTSVEMSREVIRVVVMPQPDTFAIVWRESNEPIGCIGLVPMGGEHYELYAHEREVGYWVGRPYWGKGIATEALIGLIGYVKLTTQVNSLFITADSRNVASHRVAVKAGFEKIGNYLLDGVDSVAFRLLLV